MQLIAVTNDRMTNDELLHTLLAIEQYIDAVILREKSKTDEELSNLIQMLKVEKFDVEKLIVHANPNLAFNENIRNVQLPSTLPLSNLKDQFPFLSFGQSIHSLSEAKASQESGAESVLYGHLFQSNSKTGLQPRGTEELLAIVSALTIPVYAIGGIRPSHIEQLKDLGIAGIAVMSPIFDSEHPRNIAKEYYHAIHT